MTKVGVTGAGGFLGSRLLDALIHRGVSVRALLHAAAPASDPSPLPQPVERVTADVSRPGEIAAALAGCDVVIHAAGVLRAHTPLEIKYQREIHVDGTRNVLAACLAGGVSRLVHVSSTAAIGIASDPAVPADETFTFNREGPGSEYAMSKYLAEQCVLGAAAAGVEVVVVNPGFMFGPHRDAYRGDEVLRRVCAHRVVPCTRGGLSIVHVDDVAAAIVRAAESARPGTRYILSGENITFVEIAKVVRAQVGCRTFVVPVPDLVWDTTMHMRRFLGQRDMGPHVPGLAFPFYDSRKARAELGFEPRTFAAIVSDWIQFLRAQRRE